MKKEASKVEVKKTFLPEIMSKYGAYFSLELKDGFAHVKIEDGGKMYVQWLNDEGYYEEDDNHTDLDDIIRVADFMKELKELKLQDYAK